MRSPSLVQNLLSWLSISCGQCNMAEACTRCLTKWDLLDATAGREREREYNRPPIETHAALLNRSFLFEICQTGAKETTVELTWLSAHEMGFGQDILIRAWSI